MKLHYISHPRRNPNITSSLKAACRKHSIDFIHINPFNFDFTDSTAIPAAKDLIYRASTSSAKDSLPRTVEHFLIHDKVAHLYHSFARAMTVPLQSYAIHSKYNLPIPKTIWNMSRDRDLITKYVDYVGGFPVVLKATGGSHGVGVMKIDSLPSLLSIVDYLHTSSRRVIMMEYIDSPITARIIVLNKKVVASIQYKSPPDDFRTNAGHVPNVSARTFPPTINKLAIKAVESLGYHFGGVDILIDKNKQPYIAEVNFPCNFARAESVTGINIAQQLVTFLVKQSSQL